MPNGISNAQWYYNTRGDFAKTIESKGIDATLGNLFPKIYEANKIQTQEQKTALWYLAMHGYWEKDDYQYDYYDNACIVSKDGVAIAWFVNKSDLEWDWYYEPRGFTNNPTAQDAVCQEYFLQFAGVMHGAYQIRLLLPDGVTISNKTGGLKWNYDQTIKMFKEMYPESAELFDDFHMDETGDPVEI